MNTKNIEPMTIKLIVITFIYLVCELSFNARLLDAVGTGATLSEIETLELFGRSLSGIAVALFVFQICMGLRKLKYLDFIGLKIALILSIWAAIATYNFIQVFIDHQVEATNSEFRKTSLNVGLLQTSLVNGKIKLPQLDEDTTIYSTPEGKALVALFPYMLTQMWNIEAIIQPVKTKIIREQIEKKSGGSEAIYESYLQAISAIRAQYQKYASLPGEEDIDDRVNQEFKKAWKRYLSDIGKHGWTPSSIPEAYKPRVLKQLRKSIPLPDDWNFEDKAIFKEAISQKVTKQFHKKSSIKAGMSWDEFFAQPSIQRELKNKLGVASIGLIKSSYASAADFEKSTYEPLIDKKVKEGLRQYDADLDSYEPNGKNYSIGMDSAKATLSVPIALFFSMMGAILHAAKLLYLILTVVWRKLEIKYEWALFPSLISLIAIFYFLVLGMADNKVTESQLYAKLASGYLNNSLDGNQFKQKLKLQAIHNILIGQSYSYPFNEYLRVHALAGFNFGFEAKK